MLRWEEMLQWESNRRRAWAWFQSDWKRHQLVKAEAALLPNEEFVISIITGSPCLQVNPSNFKNNKKRFPIILG